MNDTATQAPEPSSALGTLIQRLRNAKAAKKVAEREIYDIECDIYEIVKQELPQKGSMVFEDVLKITVGFTDKWNQEALDRIYDYKLQPDIKNIFPFKKEWKPDGRKLKVFLDDENLNLILSEALTQTPKKPSFTFVGDDEDAAA